MTFGSVYEILTPLTKVKLAWFVDWFSGKDLKAYWTLEDVIGAGTKGIVDAIGEGGFVQAAAAAGNKSQLNFNGIKPYDHQNSVFIMILKRLNAGNNTLYAGLGDGDIDLVGSDHAVIQDHGPNTFKTVFTSDGTTRTSTATTVNTDELFTIYRGQLSSSDFKMSIAGILEVTKTTNLPNQKLEPNIMARSSTVQAETRLRYVEVFNT